MKVLIGASTISKDPSKACLFQTRNYIKERVLYLQLNMFLIIAKFTQSNDDVDIEE